MAIRDEVSDPDGNTVSFFEWPETPGGDIDIAGQVNDNGTLRAFTGAETAQAALFNDARAARSKGDAVDTAVTTLRQWAGDAETTVATSGNAVAVLQQVVDRLGVFFDRFADLIESDKLR